VPVYLDRSSRGIFSVTRRTRTVDSRKQASSAPAPLQRELEAVFESGRGQLERLPRVLGRLSAGVTALPARRVTDQYLDTASFFFMRAGAACRLRRRGRHAVLTLKSLAPLEGGLADRREMSEIVEAAIQWPAVLPGKEIRSAVPASARRGKVRCLFEVKQDRARYGVRTREGALLEVSADRFGFGGKKERFHRIEVELKSGSARALAGFASRLARELELEPAGRSKFELGLEAEGIEIPADDEKAMRIARRDSARVAASLTMRRHYQHMLRHESGAMLGLNPDSIHQMRVGIRRFRAVMRFFRSILPEGSDAVDSGLRRVGRALGAVRDMDVHMGECDAVCGADGGMTAVAAESCLSGMNTLRGSALAALRRELAGRRYAALKRRCGELIRALEDPAPGDTPVARYSSSRLMREYRRVFTAGTAITAASPDAELHGLRVRSKRLRYACEMLEDVHSRPMRKMAKRLTALQDVLGEHSDAVAAVRLIRRMAEEDFAADRSGMGRCARLWESRARARRAAFPKAWKGFLRGGAGKRFLKCLRSDGKK